jgi:hypothetical protein
MKPVFLLCPNKSKQQDDDGLWFKLVWALFMVKSLINQNVPIIQHFFIFRHSLTKLSDFIVCHLTHKLEGYKCSLSVMSKGATQKT